MSDEEYFAGLFDGEGCVRLATPTSKKVTATIEMTNPFALQEAQRKFGGAIYYSVRRNGKPSFKWQPYTSEVYNFLYKIYPHSRVKGSEIGYALEFLRTSPVTRSGIKLDNEELERRKWYYDKLKLLKSHEYLSSGAMSNDLGKVIGELPPVD